MPDPEIFVSLILSPQAIQSFAEEFYRTIFLNVDAREYYGACITNVFIPVCQTLNALPGRIFKEIIKKLLPVQM